MKYKKVVVLLAVATLGIAGCGKGNNDTAGTKSTSTETVTLSSSGHATVSTVNLTEGKYSEEKLDASWDEKSAVKITLNGDSVTADDKNVKVDGSKVTITGAGTYVLSGTLSDGQIVVDSDDKDSVRLVLNGAEITCSNSSAIWVKDGDTIITLADGTENTLTDGTEYTTDSEDDEPKAAVYAKDDLTFNGSGSLTVNGNYKNGIQCKDALKFVSGMYTITAANNGLVGKDSVSIKDGTYTITSGGDGIKSTNTDETDQGYVIIDGGTFTITAEGDGIHADKTLNISGGTIDIQQCYEGIEGFDIVIDDGDIRVTSSDDAINAAGKSEDTDTTAESGTNKGQTDDSSPDSGNGPGGGQQPGQMNGGMEAEDQGATLTINGGNLYVNANGDGLDANGDILITGGNLTLHGPEDGGNGTLDYASECKITGGTFAAVGSNGMIQNPSEDSEQPVICQSLDSQVESGTVISVKDEEGNVITEIKTEKNVQWYAFSSSKLKVGKTYTICIGDQETEVTLESNYTEL